MLFVIIRGLKWTWHLWHCNLKSFSSTLAGKVYHHNAVSVTSWFQINSFDFLSFSFFIISIKIQHLEEGETEMTDKETDREKERYLHKTINWNNIMGFGCCNARCFTPYFKWRRDASPFLLAMLIYFMYVCQKWRNFSILCLLNYKAEESFCFINCIKWRV